MMISSWTPLELPVPAQRTGWLLVQYGPGGLPLFFANRDGVLDSTGCPVMNKLRAVKIQKRLRAQHGVSAELVSVAEYRRRLIAKALVQ